MARNRIKAVLAERGMSAKALADCVEDCNPAIVSYIANGKVLPTPECLKEMCLRLGCSPVDLYDATDVDLPSLFSDDAAASQPQDSELGKWLSAEEAAALRKAILAFGYSSVGEWVREMWRNTLVRYMEHLEGAAFNLSEVILNESRGV